MKVLVTFALEQEFAPWRRLRRFEEMVRAEAWAPERFESRLGDSRIRVVLTGMGWEHARTAALYALADDYDVCISSGFAGALAPAHRCGDVLASQSVGAERTAKAITCDREMVILAAEQGAAAVERFVCTRQLAAAPAEKAGLAAFGDAVEMESFPILSTSSAAGVRSVAIRAVSDEADFAMPFDFMRSADSRGGVRLRGVLGELARKPGKLPQLIRLGKNSRLASERLAEFLERYLAAGVASAFRTPERAVLA